MQESKREILLKKFKEAFQKYLLNPSPENKINLDQAQDELKILGYDENCN